MLCAIVVVSEFSLVVFRDFGSTATIFQPDTTENNDIIVYPASR